MRLATLALGLVACRGADAPAKSAPVHDARAISPLAEARDLESQAIALHRAGQAHKARPQLERALALITDAEGPASRALVEPLFALARLELDAGRLDEAIAAAERILAIEPDAPRAILQLADLLAAAARPVEALPIYERGAALAPDELAFRRGAALARLDTGDHAGALAALREQTDPVGLLALARVELVTGAKAEATATVAKVEQLIAGEPSTASTEITAGLAIARAELLGATGKKVVQKLLAALDGCAPATPCDAWTYGARRRIDALRGDD